MFNFLTLLSFILFTSLKTYSQTKEAESKKTAQRSYIEDVFIWKISDELKLSAQEEKKFTEISRALNKKKHELNSKIQLAVQNLSESSNELALNRYKKLIQEYNQLSISEFDSIKKLLGTKRFVSYLKIKSELTSKIKSILVSDKSNSDKGESTENKLPPPKVIVEKN